MPLRVTLQQQVQELGRELGMRSRVYASWVRSGRMNEQTANEQTDRMKAALDTVNAVRDYVNGHPEALEEIRRLEQESRR